GSAVRPVAVFDTIIFFSWVGWKGKPFECVELARAGTVEGVVCREILDELGEKLESKLSSSVQAAEGRLRNLLVLGGGDAAHTNRSDNLVRHDYRQAALHRDNAVNSKEPQLPGGDGVFHRLGRPLKQGCRARFRLGYRNTGRLGLIEFL